MTPLAQLTPASASRDPIEQGSDRYLLAHNVIFEDDEMINEATEDASHYYQREPTEPSVEESSKEQPKNDAFGMSTLLGMNTSSLRALTLNNS